MFDIQMPGDPRLLLLTFLMLAELCLGRLPLLDVSSINWEGRRKRGTKSKTRLSLKRIIAEGISCVCQDLMGGA